MNTMLGWRNAPQRIGPTSEQLSDADVASIAALFDGRGSSAC